jgi:putative colanic acid biosysnthesis UDP-glucose lipid carrier transferase
MNPTRPPQNALPIKMSGTKLSKLSNKGTLASHGVSMRKGFRRSPIAEPQRTCRQRCRGRPRPERHGNRPDSKRQGQAIFETIFYVACGAVLYTDDPSFLWSTTKKTVMASKFDLRSNPALDSVPYGAFVRRPISVPSFVRMVVDPVVAVVVLAVVTYAFDQAFTEPYFILATIAASLTGLGTQFARGRLEEILANWIVVSLILALIGYVTGYLGVFRRDLLVSWLVLTPFVTYVAHLSLSVLMPRLFALEGSRRAVVVGITDVGRQLGKRFQTDRWLRMSLLGFFDDRCSERLGGVDPEPCMGRLVDLPLFVKERRIDAIFITLPMASQPRILKLLDELRDTTASIYFVPDIFLHDLIQARVDEIGGFPVVAVCETPFYGVNGLVKRVSDLVLASVILVLTAPLMAAIALAIKLSSPGPVLFTQRRYGLDGEEIVVYKFRTMKVMEDGSEITQATKGDPRVTPIGAFLRRLSLDELPQFINVLQGRMSIVGPRPHAIAHNELYRKLIDGYMVRHKVKPGITGLAQVNGFRGETDSLEKMQGRIEHDLEYLRRWSLRLDIAIVLKTVFVVLSGRNAY